MDRLYARLLARDENFRGKIGKLCKDYIRLGEDSLNFYAASFDSAHDTFMCYARLTQKDVDKMDRGHPKNFILPMAATQIITMATMLAQMLFGTDRVHRVEGRQPETEDSAELLNQLLQWNDEQQPTYALGYNWIVNSLLYNRGIFYESYEGQTKVTFDKEMVDDPEELVQVAVVDEHGQPVLGLDGQPMTEEKPIQFARWKKRYSKTGGYNKLYIVSPYEFICDPIFPLYRLQEMRFCGHRKMVPWLELEKNSRLPMEDANYVDPTSVAKLKKNSNAGVGASAITSSTTVSESRTAYERTKAAMTPLGIAADDKDGGVVEVYELWVRLIPEDYGLDDCADPTLYQLRIGNKEHVLSVAMGTFAHDEFPYSVGEPRPSPHYQFAPSWMMNLLPIQTFVDYLKNRHQEALANTVGNVFIAKTGKVDFKDFLDPDKEGRIITVTQEAGDEDLRNIIQQVPIQDVTKDFQSEMEKFIDFGNLVSLGSPQMQGANSNDDSATASQNSLDMSKGRMASIARLLSTTALVPQTKRFVSNFQQFLEEEMWVRVRGDLTQLPQQLLGAKGVKITRDTIQGDFDFSAADGAMPGTDTRAVAAITKVIEIIEAFPQLAGGKPGDLDLRRLVLEGTKRSGFRIDKFIVPYGAPPAPDGSGGAPPPQAAQPAPQGPGGTPGGVNPPAQDVGDGLTVPDINVADTITPPEVRPQNV